MAKTKKTTANPLQISSQRTARLGFVFIAIYVVSIGIYDAWNLVTPDKLRERWLIALILLVINTTLWFFSKKRKLAPLYYQGIIFLQICMYLGVATYSIYAERGMASNAVILYAIPLSIAAIAYSGKILLLTAFASSAAYTGAAILYFRQFPSEGYKVELYGGIVFYTAIFFLLSGLLWVLVRSRNPA